MWFTPNDCCLFIKIVVCSQTIIYPQRPLFADKPLDVFILKTLVGSQEQQWPTKTNVASLKKLFDFTKEDHCCS
jgi:hypothetical protein